MGPETSLQLLHLSTGASIEDAYSAYTELQQEISRFHDASEGESGAGFQEDMALLTCAYESAVTFLSENSQSCITVSDRGDSRPFLNTDLQSTVDPSDAKRAKPAEWDKSAAGDGIFRHADHRTVEEAIAITTRRLNEAESAMPGAQEAVNTAKRLVEKARKRVETAKQANLNTIISAKSAKIRALLLDVEAKKAEKAAHTVAEKARERAVAARKAAEDARQLVDRERQQVIRAKKSEEAATAEVICAEDRMERELLRLKSLEQKLLETRNCMRMFRDTTDAFEGDRRKDADHRLVNTSDLNALGGESNADGKGVHEPLLAELQQVEVFDDIDNPQTPSESVGETDKENGTDRENERRRYPRIVYPLSRQPNFTIDDHSIPVLDLSSKGMRLGFTEGMDRRIVRGAIDFPGDEPLSLIGRVVRKDSGGMGIKLVTQIGKSVLEKERTRLAG
jgi:hypothetical protein